MKGEQYESTAPFRFLREPRLCAKPFPAEPRWEVCGLPRGFFIFGRDVIARVDFDFCF